MPARAACRWAQWFSVDAQLGVAGEAGAELQEERAELAVHAIEAEVVDHPGALHDPGAGLARAVAALPGPEQRSLLLRPPGEQDSLCPAGCLEGGKVLVHHVVLALSPGEIHPRDLLTPGEPVHRRSEAAGDPGQRGGRGDLQA
jgi:hypothetical protein